MSFEPFDPDLGYPAIATIRDDWTFEKLELNGSVRFGLSDSPDGWWLKAALSGWIPLAISTSCCRGPEGAVSGRVFDEQREPVPDYSVIVFPVNSGNWYYGARHMKAGRATESGEFTVDALPGGEYFIAAIDAAMTADNWQNPEFLNSLVPSAQRVRVAAGEGASVELHLVRVAP